MQPPTSSAALVDHRIGTQWNQNVILANTLRPLHRGRGEAFIFGVPFRCPRRSHFGLLGCPAFGNRINCFSGGFFFFDPFFFGLASSSWYSWPDWSVTAPIEPMGAPPGPANELQDNAKHEPPVTLLQLQDGSMYGLTDYWVDGDQLHYFTTYGGEGSVPIERIDFERTAKLNADRGVEFVLRAKPSTPPR
jgi:hypothetical protein